MRLALLADIHANLEALLAILAELDRHGCDRLACAGDLVGYGPSPNECVRELLARGAVCVLGNHDLMVLERMTMERCVPDGRRAARWTQRMLAPDVREALGHLPLVAEPAPGIVLCHGSLDDADAYVTTGPAARRELEQLREQYLGARLLVSGHTHRTALFQETGAMPLPGTKPGGVARLRLPEPGPWLANPGSVGQSRDEYALARGAIVDTERWEVELFSLPYDVVGCQARLFAAGLTTPLFRPRTAAPARALRMARRAAGYVRGRWRRMAAQ